MVNVQETKGKEPYPDWLMYDAELNQLHVEQVPSVTNTETYYFTIVVYEEKTTTINTIYDCTIVIVP
eukprot:CAMPEP_0176394602 /NCGR_PEP_ID=MMETSP0126-20121128/42713_1 /TAXON_ID=141414 ORGANISM="Strombidinopsis acuminatum, Strain SPMC142" /NCGR_SAMPLE_ID=MMETSP0126 /ASSEMBLY_ACC=CAM_ASM_000229 /LENGTH=66 /DNA_ID=CAMNT_0017766925 /DNA_START=2063 /DNA_END=2263 /DNA_ORIENTATION=-